MVEIQLEVGADLLALATVLVLGQPAPVAPNNLGTQCLKQELTTPGLYHLPVANVAGIQLAEASPSSGNLGRPTIARGSSPPRFPLFPPLPLLHQPAHRVPTVLPTALVLHLWNLPRVDPVLF